MMSFRGSEKPWKKFHHLLLCKNKYPQFEVKKLREAKKDYPEG